MGSIILNLDFTSLLKVNNRGAFEIKARKLAEYMLNKTNEPQLLIEIFMNKICHMANAGLVEHEVVNATMISILNFITNHQNHAYDLNKRLVQQFEDIDGVDWNNDGQIYSYAKRYDMPIEKAKEFGKEHKVEGVKTTVKNIACSYKGSSITIGQKAEIELLTAKYFFKRGGYKIEEENYTREFSELIKRALMIVRNYVIHKSPTLVKIYGNFVGSSDSTGENTKCPAYYNADINGMKSINISNYREIKEGCMTNLDLSYLRAYSIYSHFLNILTNKVPGIMEDNFKEANFKREVSEVSGSKYRFAKITIHFGQTELVAKNERGVRP